MAIKVPFQLPELSPYHFLFSNVCIGSGPHTLYFKCRSLIGPLTFYKLIALCALVACPQDSMITKCTFNFETLLVWTLAKNGWCYILKVCLCECWLRMGHFPFTFTSKLVICNTKTKHMNLWTVLFPIASWQRSRSGHKLGDAWRIVLVSGWWTILHSPYCLRAVISHAFIVCFTSAQDENGLPVEMEVESKPFQVKQKNGCMEKPEQEEIWLVEILISKFYHVEIIDDYITQPKPQKTWMYM